MATPAATYCNVGVGSGKNNYKLDYSPTDGGGILTLTAAQYNASTGVTGVGTGGTDIMYDSPDGMMMLRADVDTDPIATDGYPRTEGREMALDGTTVRSFDRTTGDHWVKIIFKVPHLPPKKPSVVVCQMHDENDDIIEFAVQPATGYNETTNPKVELVCRINGTSSGIPKLVADFQYNTVYQAKIRVGAIAAGPAVGWEAYVGNMTTPKLTSSQAGMPAMTLTGTQNYFKWGCYLQTKHTGNGTGGLETDVNEYGVVGYRDVQTFHNGEAVPGVLTFGTQTFDAISNVRWAAATELQNTAGDPAGLVPVAITPALPGSLVNGDMMYAISRTRRTATGSLPSTQVPSTPATPTGWTRLVSTKSTTTGASSLVAHNIRFQLYCKKWVNGDVAPVFNYLATTTTDLVNIQLFAVSGSKYSVDLLNLLDQPPAGLDLTNPSDNTNTVTGITYAAAASTTAVGPTGTITGAAPGSMVLALVAHEINLITTAAVGVVTGGADGLTWIEGGEGVQLTTAGHGWANDYAIVPGSGAATNIAAKSAAATLAADADPITAGSQAGKGWGLVFSLAPAKRVGRRRAN